MKANNKTEEVISNIKSITAELTPEERESVRDQLIAFLLFSRDLRITQISDPQTERIQGLTEEERDLIRKIAEQTERLHRMMNSEEDDRQEGQ
jgi:hypothetical protein